MTVGTRAWHTTQMRTPHAQDVTGAPGAQLYASARRYATWGLAGGAAASVAANFTHAALAPAFSAAHVPSGGVARTVSMIGAVVWPLAFLGAVEVLTRTPWRRGFWWLFLRYIVTVGVAALAGSISYRNMRTLLWWTTGDAWTATAGPLVVDGTMFICALALLSLTVLAQVAIEPNEVPVEPNSDPVESNPAPQRTTPTAPGPPRGGRTRSRVAPEVRAHAVARVLDGAPGRRIAAEIGVSEAAVRTWVNRHRQADTGNGHGKPLTVGGATDPPSGP